MGRLRIRIADGEELVFEPPEWTAVQRADSGDLRVVRSRRNSDTEVVAEIRHGVWLWWRRETAPATTAATSAATSAATTDGDVPVVLDVDEPAEERLLGLDPVGGAQVVVRRARLGDYVTDGVTTAALRRQDDPGTIDLDRALALLEGRRMTLRKPDLF